VRGIVIVNLLSRSIFPVSENITPSIATSLAETYFLSIVLSLSIELTRSLASSLVRLSAKGNTFAALPFIAMMPEMCHR